MCTININVVQGRCNGVIESQPWPDYPALEGLLLNTVIGTLTCMSMISNSMSDSECYLAK